MSPLQEESGCDEDEGEDEEEGREEEDGFDSDESLVDSDSDSDEKGVFLTAATTKWPDLFPFCVMFLVRVSLADNSFIVSRGWIPVTLAPLAG